MSFHKISGKRNDAFREALLTGEVDLLLRRFHSQDVADYYGVAQTSIQKEFKGHSDKGKERTNLAALSRESQIRKFVTCSAWTLENSEKAFARCAL